MDEFLNENLGENFQLLPDLLRSLAKERDSLQNQLSGTIREASHSEWQLVVGDVRNTVAELEGLRDTCISLSGVGGEGGGEGGLRRGLLQAGAGECAREIRPLAKETLELEHLRAYLQWMRRLQLLSSQIESHLHTGSLSAAVEGHAQLDTLCSALKPSSCSHLQRFAAATRQHWSQQLRERFSSAFSESLKELKWPFTASVSSKTLDLWDKQQKPFSELFHLLLLLDDEGPSPSPPPPGVPPPTLKDHVILPIELLLEPLRKRFKFHFYGEKKTNSKEKPEWYFTQVSAWIRDHTHFLENRIQPLLDESALSHVDARLEFIRGLLQEAEAKLLHDLPSVVYDDLLMSHLVDELLLFEKELRTVLGYPRPRPSLLHVLLEEVPLHKWLSLEKGFAVERLSAITSSPSAWLPAYASLDGADETRVPECTEGLMQLIAGITDRYRPLSSPAPQLRFLELQTDLLLEFHHDLAAAARQASHSPLVPQFCAYLNASSYIVDVLRDWGEQKFYLELYYHSKRTQSPEDNDGGSSPQPLSPPPDIDSLCILRRQDPEFASSEGAAFDTVIAVFSSLAGDIEMTLEQHVVGTVKAKCKSYKKEKWHSMVLEKPPLPPDVTSSASDLLLTLGGQLEFIAGHVSQVVVPALCERIGDRIDQILVSDVILNTHFSEGGASQLRYDVTKLLLPLLSQFCDDVASMQLLERTREALNLLQLLPGSARLLQELLESVVGAGLGRAVDSEAFAAAVTALNDIGVHSLTPRQAEHILRLRITS